MGNSKADVSRRRPSVMLIAGFLIVDKGTPCSRQKSEERTQRNLQSSWCVKQHISGSAGSNKHSGSVSSENMTQ